MTRYFLCQMLRCLSCRHCRTGFDVVESADRFWLECEKNAKIPNEKCKNYRPPEVTL